MVWYLRRNNSLPTTSTIHISIVSFLCIHSHRDWGCWDRISQSAMTPLHPMLIQVGWKQCASLARDRKLPWRIILSFKDEMSQVKYFKSGHNWHNLLEQAQYKLRIRSKQNLSYTCCTWAEGTFFWLCHCVRFLVVVGNGFWFYFHT